MEGSYIPVAWQDLTYRVTDGTITYTEVLPELCNPAVPSPVQGQVYPLDDGTYSCPAIYNCLDPDCESNDLTPNSDGFPDLRTCVCSYTEVVHPYYDALPKPANDEYIIPQIKSGNMTPTDDTVSTLVTPGIILCNDAAARTCDVMLSIQNPTYVPQCINLAVNYFDNNPSRYFGLFWKANPSYQYDIDRVYWTEGHYRGIASLLNYKMYVRSGQYVDPFTKKLWVDYFWFDSAEGFNIETQTVTFEEDNSTYQAYFFQADPYISLLNSEPALPVDFSLDRGATEQQKRCIELAHILGDFSECAGLTWNITDSAGFHLAGYENTFPIEVDQYLVSVTVTILESNSDIKGIEVYNAAGDLCGSLFPDGVTEDDVFSFACYDVNSSTILTGGKATVRLLGLASIYDVPEQNLNSADLETLSDPLASVIDELEFEAYKDGSLPLCFASIYDRLNYRNWPQRRTYNFDYNPFDGLEVTYNYTYTTSTSIGIINAFQNITEAIYTNNTYPFNYALEAIESSYATEAYNYSSQKQLDFLYNFWVSELAPRRSGADDTACLTAGKGKSVLLPDTVQYWYTGERVPGYRLIAGREGGCLCHSSFGRGLFKLQLGCKQCVDGYGPESLADFAGTVQYNTLVAQLYPEGTFPSSISLEYFNENIVCRFPYGKDPVVSSLKDINMCAGHGVMSYENSTAEVNVTVWERNLITACSAITTPTATFQLFENITSIFSLIYIDEDDNILTVIGSKTTYEIYLNGDLCSAICTENLRLPEPWSCELTCNEEVDQYICFNEAIFTPTANNFSALYTPNIFILELPI